MIIVFSLGVRSEWCYQESANKTATCDSIITYNTGIYDRDESLGYANYGNESDENYNTYNAPSPTDGIFFVNYTIPNNIANTESFWQVKDKGNLTNLTIIHSCWNSTTTKLRLRVYGDKNGDVYGCGSNCLSWECLNSSGGYSILRLDNTEMWYYEEAMHWYKNDSIINISFYDEQTNTLINESVTILFLKEGFSETRTTTKNPHYSNYTEKGTYTLRVSSVNYPQRDLRNVIIKDLEEKITFYLINSTNSQEVTFQLRDEGLNAIDNVNIYFYTIINGLSTLVAEEITSYDGEAKLNLNPNTEYTINFTANGYDVLTMNLEPSDTTYVVQLVSATGQYNTSIHEGLLSEFSPKNINLINKTDYNFTYTLNSSIWSITDCNLTLLNGSTAINISSGYTASGCRLQIEYNTGTLSNITVKAQYQLNDEYSFIELQDYSIIWSYEGQFSLKNFFDDLTELSESGFNTFSRFFIVIIVIFIITAFAVKNADFSSKESIILLVVTLVWFFSYVNWFYLPFNALPEIAGFDLKKYIIAIVITLAGGGFLFDKYLR